MASSSIFTTLFMSAILFSSQINVVTSSRPTPGPSSIFQEICRETNDPKYCVQFFQTKPQMQSVKNVRDATIGIMEWGMSNVTSIIGHVKMSLNKPGIAPNVKAALELCTETYKYINTTFEVTIRTIKEDNDEDKMGSYNLHSACYDDMQRCKIALATEKIYDDTIENTNKVIGEISGYATEGLAMLPQTVRE